MNIVIGPLITLLISSIAFIIVSVKLFTKKIKYKRIFGAILGITGYIVVLIIQIIFWLVILGYVLLFFKKVNGASGIPLGFVLFLAPPGLVVGWLLFYFGYILGKPKEIKR